MSSLPSRRVSGLWTGPNQLAAPEGALLRADNCVIRSKDFIEPRRGQELLAKGGFLGGTDYANVLLGWNGAMYGHFGTNKMATWGGAGWNDLGSTHTPPDATVMRMKFAAAAERLYFTTSAGPYRTTGGAAVIAAGRQAILDWADSHATADSNGFLSLGTAVAYRTTLRDQIGSRWVQGPASGRITVTNPSSVDVPIGGLVRTGGNTVTVTVGNPHGFKYGDVLSMLPGEANFAAGNKTITQILSNFVFVYSEAGANAASTALETFLIGNKALAKVRVLLPSGTNVNTVVELWRSLAVAEGDTPGEDMFLAYQGYPSATDVSNGFMDISDNTPEIFLGDPGYFTPAVDGITASKEAPPLAYDLAPFDDVMVYGNLVEKHLLEVRLIATGGTTGVVSGNTLTIARGGSSFAVTYAHNQTGGQAVVYDNGSPAGDVAATAQATVDAINSHSGNTFVDAFYVSGDNDSPGLILLRARDFSTVAFTVTCTRALAWTPELSSTKQKATSDQLKGSASVAWSWPGEPDAVPALNRQVVGDPLEKVLRVLPLRNRIIILKEHSAWSMSGSYGAYRFDLLDNTVDIFGPDTAVVFNNQVHALTSMGVASITEVGVGLLSQPIETDLAVVLNNSPANVKRYAWGAAWNIEHSFLIGLPTAGGDISDVVYVWNAMTSTWTKWPIARGCATVDPTTGLLWLGDLSTASARRERKSFSASDYKDEQTAVTLTSASGAVLNLTSNTGVEVGDYIELQSNSSVKSRVVSVSGDGHHVTVANSLTWGSSVGVYIDKAYACDVQWLPAFMGDPSVDKQVYDLKLHFRDASFATGYTYTSTDISPTEEASQPLSTTNGSGPANVRSSCGPKTSYSSYFTLRWHIREALASWKLQGWSMGFNPGGERSQR